MTKLNRSIQNMQPYIQWYKIEPKEYERSSRLHMICISSNNDRYTITKTCTPLHYTSQHLSTLYFFPFKLRPTTLHYTSLYFTTLSFGLTPFNFPTASFHLTSLHFTSLHCTFRWFLPHVYSFCFTLFIIAFLTL